MASFSTTFRIILPDTLDLSRRDMSEPRVDEFELDALDNLVTRLKDRQVIHRISDREMVHNVSQVIRNILLKDDPGNRFTPTRPGLYTVNCPQCHLIGASQLRSAEISLPVCYALISIPDCWPMCADASCKSDPTGTPEIRLPPQSRCIYCRETISIAREVPIARQTWELLGSLQPDADTVNVERHLPTQFQLGPPKAEASGSFSQGYNNGPSTGRQKSADNQAYGSSYPGQLTLGSPTSIDLSSLAYPGLVSPQTPGPYQPSIPLRNQPSQQDISNDQRKKTLDDIDPLLVQVDPSFLTEPPPFSHDSPGFRRIQGADEGASISTPRTVPLVAPPDKGKSKWRLKFTTTKKAPVGVSNDSSSLSSTALEAQRLEEISLSALLTTPKGHSRGKPSKNINVNLSQNSTLALFWTQSLIHVWDVSTSPPTMMRTILPESTCILAAVARTHVAYIIGTRDQRLTVCTSCLILSSSTSLMSALQLRVVNLLQPTIAVVEYRIPSNLWCKSIAIDREENYVVVGFEHATVRFFKARVLEHPREDRLHALFHKDCRGCPSVDTLAFSNDGLALLASTRSPKTGLVQTYLWRFPFNSLQELVSCRYPIPLHESEDNGVSAALFRPGADGEDNLVCITTWTQSGTPILIQPQDGHRSEIKTDVSSRFSKIGNRIQCAAFSSSGKDLAMVNDKGHVFQVSNLNSSPMDIRRIASSKELTAKTESFAMNFMMLSDEEHVVVAWADSSRATGWIKKIPACRVSIASNRTTITSC